MKNKYQELQTDYKMSDIPLNEYPRPQFKRDSYINLNGEWDLAFYSKFMIPPEGFYIFKINVPYPVESQLSNIKKVLNYGDALYYKKEIDITEEDTYKDLILHLDGVDQIADIYLNDELIVHHEGGYIPFEVKLNGPYLEIGKNTLIIRVIDDLNKTYPYGKQSKISKGMWYTKTSGIWKSVWLEKVDKFAFKYIRYQVIDDEVKIIVDHLCEDPQIIIYLDNGEVIKQDITSKEFKIKIPHPHYWSSEDPYLYKVELVSPTDKVESYFALRTIEIRNGQILINKKKVFFHGLLDQGYYPDGLLTPKSYKAYEDEIKLMKELGFNTLRKHIKIEPLYFYYLCDKYGMYVFQDMVNNSEYKFFRDTILPTLGFVNYKTGKDVPSDNKKIFIKQMQDTASLLYNSPSVIYYTIFNEGWGQFDEDEVYQELMYFDDTRIVDTTSGWFFGSLSDVNSYHIYFKKLKLPKKRANRPTIISEFGGYVYKINEHSYNLSSTYGYKIFKDQDKFQAELKNLYLNQVVPLINEGLQGVIYTQVSDVEDETNGLLTYDRKVLKVNKKDMLEIKKAIDEAFYK